MSPDQRAHSTPNPEVLPPTLPATCHNPSSKSSRTNAAAINLASRSRNKSILQCRSPIIRPRPQSNPHTRPDSLSTPSKLGPSSRTSRPTLRSVSHPLRQLSTTLAPAGASTSRSAPPPSSPVLSIRDLERRIRNTPSPLCARAQSHTTNPNQSPRIVLPKLLYAIADLLGSY